MRSISGAIAGTNQLTLASRDRPSGEMSRIAEGLSQCCAISSSWTSPHCATALLWSYRPGKPRWTTSSTGTCRATKNGPIPVASVQRVIALSISSNTDQPSCTTG